MLPLFLSQLLKHGFFLGKVERRELKMQNREEMHTGIRLSFFSAIKDLAEEGSPPRQVTWLGYVPSHILAPPSNYELFEAKITLIPKIKVHEHLLSACLALWLLFACVPPAHTGCPHLPFHALFGNWPLPSRDAFHLTSRARLLVLLLPYWLLPLKSSAGSSSFP